MPKRNVKLSKKTTLFMRAVLNDNARAAKQIQGSCDSVQFTNFTKNSKIYERIKQGIFEHAPADKQIDLLTEYRNFIEKPSDLKVMEQLFNAAEKYYLEASESELIRYYNKIFKKVKTLKANNPQDYEIMVKGGFFDLVEQGKISIYNFRTDFTNARVSRSLLEDLRKIANHEELIPDYTKLSEKEIGKLVRNGDVYTKGDKLFTRNNGVETEIHLSKEKFEELFPPVLRHISNQGKLGDCWLVGRLDNLMSTESGRSGIYSLFRQSGDDIYIKFPNCDKEILFPFGMVLKSEKQVDAVKGITMLEQAYAVHRTGRYAKGKITDITRFKNAESLMNNLDGTNFRAMYIHDEARKKDVLDLISNEATYELSSRSYFLNMFKRFIDKCILNRKIFNKCTSKNNMKEIINSQANADNLKINIGFKKSNSYFSEMYNMVPNHQLTLKAIEEGKYWISNPWFNWIEKGVDEEIFYNYLIDAQVPMVWAKS